MLSAERTADLGFDAGTVIGPRMVRRADSSAASSHWNSATTRVCISDAGTLSNSSAAVALGKRNLPQRVQTDVATGFEYRQSGQVAIGVAAFERGGIVTPRDRPGRVAWLSEI